MQSISSLVRCSRARNGIRLSSPMCLSSGRGISTFHSHHPAPIQKGKLLVGTQTPESRYKWIREKGKSHSLRRHGWASTAIRRDAHSTRSVNSREASPSRPVEPLEHIGAATADRIAGDNIASSHWMLDRSNSHARSLLTRSVSFEVALFQIPHAEGVEQLSPGQSRATQSRGAALGYRTTNKRGRELVFQSIAALPRPQQAAVCFGLGRLASTMVACSLGR